MIEIYALSVFLLYKIDLCVCVCVINGRIVIFKKIVIYKKNYGYMSKRLCFGLDFKL